MMSTQEPDNDESNVGTSDGKDAAALIEAVLSEPIHFDDLVFERDVSEADPIEELCKFYTKHSGKASKKQEEIADALEFQISELICVIAWEHCSTSGERNKNDIKWGSLTGHFDNIVSNFPQKHWWRESLMKFLPAGKIPQGVIAYANKH